MRRGDPADNEPAAEGGEFSGAIARMGGSLRAWSLAVSFLGDCIVPRGGDVGMATITEVLSTFGIEPGVTRTAMSRLAGDGWVTRQKVGRMSFYALTPDERQPPFLRQFRRMSRDAPHCPEWDECLRDRRRVGEHDRLRAAVRPSVPVRRRGRNRPVGFCGRARTQRRGATRRVTRRWNLPAGMLAF